MHCARRLIPCLLKHTWHDLDAWQIMLTSWVFNAADWTKQTCCSKSHKPYVSKKVESNNVYDLLMKLYFILYLPSYITFKTGEKKHEKSCHHQTHVPIPIPLSSVIILCLPRVIFVHPWCHGCIFAVAQAPLSNAVSTDEKGPSQWMVNTAREVFPIPSDQASCGETPCWRNHRFVALRPLN